MKEFICPHCESYFTLDNNLSRCPFCGKEIDNKQSNSFNSDKELYRNLENGFLLLEKEDFSSLKELGLLLIEKYPTVFWGYCFASIGKIEIDISKPISQVSYQLNDLEIQEDLKARIYHKARYKYHKCTSMTYEAICDHYPDVPGEKRGEWKKCHTNYDKKIKFLNEKIVSFEYVKKTYLSKMEINSINEKEIAIVHNFRLWLDYLLHGVEELKKYNHEANTFVEKDYKQTPNPGNRVNFSLYLLLMVASLFIFSFSMVSQILVEIISKDIFFIIDIILSSIVSLLYILLGVFLTIKGKIFLKGNIFLGSLIIVLASVISSLNVFFVFHESIFKNIFGIIITLTGFIFTFFSIWKMNYYLPRNTYQNGTYIGNYKALVTNNFEVEFSYTWKTFSKGEELLVGTISEYLLPYMC